MIKHCSIRKSASCHPLTPRCCTPKSHPGTSSSASAPLLISAFSMGERPRHRFRGVPLRLLLPLRVRIDCLVRPSSPPGPRAGGHEGGTARHRHCLAGSSSALSALLPDRRILGVVSSSSRRSPSSMLLLRRCRAEANLPRAGERRVATAAPAAFRRMVRNVVVPSIIFPGASSSSSSYSARHENTGELIFRWWETKRSMERRSPLYPLS
uniref:Uncharacterized protein n=1 Tax=Odontella aurita TaxID=265563 RepID=A0A7S4IV46_9STRA|mmetsp:Transcript_30640/g.91684  ORF Transcript_30640/g.91684 Transcript_30640/m.91684 type:complete len:210 (+) Transcript_30640:168-797(+)